MVLSLPINPDTRYSELYTPTPTYFPGSVNGGSSNFTGLGPTRGSSTCLSVVRSWPDICFTTAA